MGIINRTIRPAFQQITRIKIPEARWDHLDNTIPVILLEAGTQPVIRIEFIYKAGKWFEDASGIAMATCSMLIEGTRTKHSQQISEELDSLGAFLSPFIEADRAGLVLYCLSRNFSRVLALTADLLNNSIFPKEELDIYLRKSKEQLLINQEQVSYLGRKGLLKIIFGPEHPYGRPVEPEDYDQIHHPLLINYHEQYFQKGVPYILASGKWDFDLLKEVNLHFGNRSQSKKETGKPVDFPVSNPKRNLLTIPKHGAVQSALTIGKRVINLSHHDYNGLKILTVLLGGYFGSRLMKNIREEKGYTYGISAHLVSMEHAGYLVISSEVKSEVCKPAIQEVFFELKRLREVAIEKKELDLVRNYLMGNWLSMFDGPFNQADSFRTLVDYDLNESYFTRSIKDLQEITPERLQELANKYFQEESFVTVVAG